MDNSGWWWRGGRFKTSMCHFPLERPFPVHSFWLIKGETVFLRYLFLWPPPLLLPFQTRSIFCLLWTNYFLPPVCSAIVNHNQWREEPSQSWLRWMTQVLLSLWKPSFRETHAESAAHDSVGCSLPCQSVPTLIAWHSEKDWAFVLFEYDVALAIK